jgi:hypothetical protein
MAKSDYMWACEIDRDLKLGLSNGQIELLARMLYPDPAVEARKLLQEGQSAVLRRLGVPSRVTSAA